jgi:riboflavin transporter 2
MLIGVSASLLLVVFWDETTVIGGDTHSTALFVLVFFLSLVDCTSSVLFLPFMAIFR